jgi:hypothetical protein
VTLVDGVLLVWGTPAILLATTSWTTPVLAFLGFVVTALGTYAVARRKSSGSIKTTEAETLWKESSAMRAELRAELEAQEGELKLQRDHNRVLQAEVQSLQSSKSLVLHAHDLLVAETERYRQAEERCRLEVITLEDRNAELEAKIAEMGAKIAEMEARHEAEG